MPRFEKFYGHVAGDTGHVLQLQSSSPRMPVIYKNIRNVQQQSLSAICIR